MRKSKVTESDRSEEVRKELRKQDYRTYWEVSDWNTRVTYYTNGLGKALLLLEHAHDTEAGMKWMSWDLYRPLTTSNKISDTYAALEIFTGAVI
jgi:hypothetical protein